MNRWPRSIRTHLVVLVCVSVLPVLAFSTVMTALFWRQQRSAFEQRYLERVRAMSLALDRELSGQAAALRTLSRSPRLQEGDVAGFREAAERFRAEQPSWATIVLTDGTGRQLLDLRQPPGSPRPAQMPSAEVLSAALRTDEPVISGLFLDRSTGGYSTALAVRATANGRTTYGLLAVIEEPSWLRFLERYPIAPGATMTLLDKSGVIIARTLNNDRWVGRPPAPKIREMVATIPAAAYQSRGLEGQRFYSAHSRSSFAGWIVATGVPSEGVEAALRGSMLATVGGASLMVVLALGVAVLLGRRIARPVRALGSAAAALARGAPVEAEAMGGVAEVSAAATALRQAARDIDERQAALSRSHVEAETARDELQQRVGALMVLADLSRRLIPRAGLEEPLLEILDAAIRITRADLGNIQLRNPTTGSLDIAVQSGFEPEFLEYFARVDNQQAACGMAMAMGQRIIVRDVRTDPIFADPEVRGVMERAGARAVQSTPLYSRTGDLLGMLSTHYHDAREPHERDLQMLDVLGRLASDFIDRARAESEADAAHARLEVADRAKDEFLAMLGHELRNPLGAIAGAVRVLELAGDSPDQRERARAVIGRQVRHLSRLVDDLLDVSRVTTGKVLLLKRPLDLGALARAAASAWREGGRFGRHDVRIEASPDKAVWIEGDAVRIEQIIDNLVGNALKYTPPGGVVTLRVAREGADAVLEVTDSGEGIPPALIGKIFDLFVQGDQAADRSQGGLGIGLTLVHRLAALHGGTVSAHSDGSGRGSRFTVRLPAVSPRATQGAPEVEQRPETPRRVLIIEDNEDERAMLQLTLSLAGHEVFEAGDGDTGIRMATDLSPEVAVVDIGLPGRDGFSVARALRANEGGRRIRLVAMTGYGQAEDRYRAIEAGFDVHLTKPVAPERLAAVIRESSN